MQPEEMEKLIGRHVKAEMAGDADGAVSVYTDDVVHDVVGWPGGPMRGRDGAHAFYDELIENFRTEEMLPIARRYGADFAVLEHRCTGTVPGTFLGIPGRGRRISFRLLHVWEFRDGKISRENVWLDGGSIVAQLSA